MLQNYVNQSKVQNNLYYLQSVCSGNTDAFMRGLHVFRWIYLLRFGELQLGQSRCSYRMCCPEVSFPQV